MVCGDDDDLVLFLELECSEWIEISSQHGRVCGCRSFCTHRAFRKMKYW